MKKPLVAFITCLLLCGAIVGAQLTDSLPNPSSVGAGATYLLGWNGAAWVRVKSASLATMILFSDTTSIGIENGRLFAEKPGRWAIRSTPAVSLQATATIAAQSVVRHVADTVCFSAGSTTAPALTKLNVNLRDGATGAGTIMHSWTVVIPAATGQNVPPVCFNDLQISGSTNTAMTLEFSSLLTNLFEDVTLTGWNIF